MAANARLCIQPRSFEPRWFSLAGSIRNLDSKRLYVCFSLKVDIIIKQLDHRYYMIDVLCVGMAANDLVFSVGHHPAADEKVNASALSRSGGGPAANAAVAVSRLGYSAAFAGYLGHDPFGEAHLAELTDQGVITDLISRGTAQSSLSAILVKPDGRRTVVNFREHEPRLAEGYHELLRSHPSTDFQKSLTCLDLQRAASICPLEWLGHRPVEVINERQNAFT